MITQDELMKRFHRLRLGDAAGQVGGSTAIVMTKLPDLPMRAIGLPGFGPDDDRARNYHGAHDDSALGPTVCSGVRKALEPLRSTG
jgi:hypothetical protein